MKINRVGISGALPAIVGLFLISLALGSVTVSAPRDQTIAEGGVSSEEYEIYSTLIQQKYVESKTKLLVIEDRTFRYDFAVDNDEPWRDKTKKGIAIDPSAAEEYETRNSRQWLFTKTSFKLPAKVDFITDLDLKAIFHGHWGELEWISYYRRYADSRGFIMLSRIGFNTAHTQALVYMGSRCGRGCGDLNFLLLEKVNGTWAIRKELRKKDFG
ncbi:MAG: hypothetical protein ABJB97_11930 [Acidobacteriota bacterium]